MPSRRLIVVLALLITGTFALGLNAAIDRREDDKARQTATEPGLQPTDSPTPTEPGIPTDSPTPDPSESPSDLPTETPSESPSEAPTDPPTAIAEPPSPDMPNTGADPATGVAALLLVGAAIVVRRVRTAS